MTNQSHPKKMKRPEFIAIGLALGVGFGAAMDNIGLGIAIGLAIGAGLAHRAKKDKVDKSDMNLLKKLNDLVDVLLKKAHVLEAIQNLKDKVGDTDEPFVWSVLDNSDWQTQLSETIKSGWIFVLKKDTPSGCHYHPNSVQHMVMVEGTGESKVGEESKTMILFGSKEHTPADTWYVIDKGIEHEFFPSKTDMVVISFHTCKADELQEISFASEEKRLYEG